MLEIHWKGKIFTMNYAFVFSVLLLLDLFIRTSIKSLRKDADVVLIIRSHLTYIFNHKNLQIHKMLF